DIPSASATFRIERPWLNNTLICSCIRAVFLSLAMAGTSAMPSRSCARRRSPLPGNLTTLQMVVNSADHLWSTSRANGWSTSLIRGGQLRCKRVVNSKCNRTACRAADTGCAAEAAALAVKFSLSGDPLDAMECLSAADGALDQSPLGNKEQFRRWFSSIAIPAAWANRGLSPAEQEAFRSYDPDSLATEGGD